MKVYAISDLHLASVVNKPMDIFKGWDNHIQKILQDWQARVTNDDVVLLSGDLSWAMEYKNAIDDISLIGDLNGKKIIIKGNHDYWWKSISNLRQNLPLGMYALQNDTIRLGNLLVCGTRGWTQNSTKEEDKKIYNREVERLKLSLQSLKKQVNPADTIIAMAHYPPYNANQNHYTSSPFTKLYTEYDIKTVVYGHLHGTHNKTPLNIKIDDTNYLLTSCDLVGHKLIEIATICN